MRNFFLSIWAFFSQEHILIKEVVRTEYITKREYVVQTVCPRCHKYLIEMEVGKFECTNCCATKKMLVYYQQHTGVLWKHHNDMRKRKLFADSGILGEETQRTPIVEYWQE